MIKLNKIFSIFKKKSPPKKQGFLVFSHTSGVIQAENLLKSQGFNVEIKGPPPQLQTGCDMVILFDLIYAPSILSFLEKNSIKPLRVVALANELLEPVELFHTKDYGDWFMVRAANMKITLEKASGRIVNISGGGCPDVPYLASLLLNKNIQEAEEPRIKGKTLCSYSLQKAFLEAKKRFAE